MSHLPTVLYMPYVDLAHVDVELRPAVERAAEQGDIDLTVGSHVDRSSEFDLVIGPDERGEPDTDVAVWDLGWMLDGFVPGEFVGSPGLGWLGSDRPGGVFERDSQGWQNWFDKIGNSPLRIPLEGEAPSGGLGGRVSGGDNPDWRYGMWLWTYGALSKGAAKKGAGAPSPSGLSPVLQILDAFFKGWEAAKAKRRTEQAAKKQQESEATKAKGKSAPAKPEDSKDKGTQKDGKKKEKPKGLDVEGGHTDFILAVNRFTEKASLVELWERIRSGNLDSEPTDVELEARHWVVYTHQGGIATERHLHMDEDPGGHGLRYWLSMKAEGAGDDSFEYWYLWHKGAPIDPIDAVMMGSSRVFVAGKKAGSTGALELRFA